REVRRHALGWHQVRPRREHVPVLTRLRGRRPVRVRLTGERGEGQLVAGDRVAGVRIVVGAAGSGRAGDGLVVVDVVLVAAGELVDLVDHVVADVAAERIRLVVGGGV